MRCPSCGTEAEGNFCSSCGTRLLADGGCPHCGSPLSPDAMFCGECGNPLGQRQRKSVRAYLPWALSGLALVAFSVAIALFVQSASSPRAGDVPLTGGISSAEPPATGGGATPGSAASGGSAGTGMPSAAELANMTPRQAADRLFDRAMTERETGDPERGQFFAQMAIQAYGQIPLAELDTDAHLHLGLLQLALGNPEGAHASAATILDPNPNQLFGLLIEVRAAGAAGDTAALAAARDRFRAAVAGGETPDLPVYEPHRTLLENFLAELGAGVEGGG
jgi:predicted nucleic acid-binding Zn ribbon protein